MRRLCSIRGQISQRQRCPREEVFPRFKLAPSKIQTVYPKHQHKPSLKQHQLRICLLWSSRQHQYLLWVLWSSKAGANTVLFQHPPSKRWFRDQLSMRATSQSLGANLERRYCCSAERNQNRTTYFFEDLEELPLADVRRHVRFENQDFAGLGTYCDSRAVSIPGKGVDSWQDTIKRGYWFAHFTFLLISVSCRRWWWWCRFWWWWWCRWVSNRKCDYNIIIS